MPETPSLLAQLRDALRVAMKERDRIAAAALRTALGVIDNAESVDQSAAPAVEPGHIAGGVAGLGAGEVARRELSDAQLVVLLRDEVAQWEATARDYEHVHHDDDAARLRAEVAVLRPFLSDD